MLRAFSNVIRPSVFQGAGRDRGYFEGYYVKIVDPERGVALALVPGVSYDAAGAGHAFVQVLDGVAATSAYHRFDVAEFAFGKTRFALLIGGNLFSEEGARLRLPGLELDVRFGALTPWPAPWYAPGAMGPFAFAPGMQCRHGVVSLHHAVRGVVRRPGAVAGGSEASVALSPRAVGYIEKDWGASFPRAWIWLQSSHLDGVSGPACLSVSVGDVPWVTGAFTGFIAALYWGGELLRFATYLGCRFAHAVAGETVRLRFWRPPMRGRGALRLDIAATGAPGAVLVSPVASAGMAGRVNESLTATAEVRLRENGREVLRTTARWCGLEVAGAL